MDYSDSMSTSASSSSDQITPSSPPKRKSGRKKFQVTRHPIYRGVRERSGGKWVCEVREPHKKTRIWLGTYSAPEMAARAHDVAALALRGKSAILNFPDSSWALPIPRSARPEDIRLAATQAAAMCETWPNSKRMKSEKMRANEEVSSSAPPAVSFLDEEAIFNMPAMLTEMAAGLLITPPGMEREFDWDEAEFMADEMPLWQHDFLN